MCVRNLSEQVVGRRQGTTRSIEVEESVGKGCLGVDADAGCNDYSVELLPSRERGCAEKGAEVASGEGEEIQLDRHFIGELIEEDLYYAIRWVSKLQTQTQVG